MLPPTEPDLTGLNDEQLSDALAALDAAEVVSKNRDISMAASAHWYAATLRWPVFPLKARGKAPLTPHGFKDASRDPDKVAAWWKQWPDANIGVPTGSTDQGGCGYDVLDVDGSAGMTAWATLKHARCAPDCNAETFCPGPGPYDIHARAWTPGDGVKRGPGRHLYIAATGVGNATRIRGVSIDWRGAGGYVVAPPSVGLSGVRYAWITQPPMGGVA